jgi:hypothetical protein
VSDVWQAREVGELRKRGRLVEIGRWRKNARRRKNAKPPYFDDNLIEARGMKEQLQELKFENATTSANNT